MRPSGYLGLVVEELFFFSFAGCVRTPRVGHCTENVVKTAEEVAGTCATRHPALGSTGGWTDAKLKVAGVRAVSQVLFLHKLSPPAVFGTSTQPRGGKNYAIDGLYLRALSVSGYLFCPLFCGNNLTLHIHQAILLNGVVVASSQ